MLGRLNPCIVNNPTLLTCVCFFGLITSTLGGLVAAYQTDAKKVLAYSTISHCGVLMFLTTLPDYSVLYIYLVSHGLFKSLSFMAMGRLVAKSGSQDIRFMGAAFIPAPIESILLAVALSGLASLPFGLGFFNKALFMSNALYLTPQLYT
jgi:multicomponent K+:H+ antiporter subunit A